MPHIYVPINSPDDWKRLLDHPERQWRTGYSARTIAHSWLASDGLPLEVRALFTSSGIPAFDRIEPLIIVPEHQVHLPPASGHPSQNDVFVLAKASDGALVSIAVEGKVSESFGDTIAEWASPLTAGKAERLRFLKDTLGLGGDIPQTVRYQLLHRLASAVLEAGRFGAGYAALVVHSFGQSDEWFDDFAHFVSLFGAQAKLGTLVSLCGHSGIALYAGWARGDPRFLAA